jgi:hypothetical protein
MYCFGRHVEYVATQTEKKMILSEWRDEKSKLGHGGVPREDSRAGSAAPGAGPGARSASAGRLRAAPSNPKFDEAALAAKRERVEQWRRAKEEESGAEAVLPCPSYVYMCVCVCIHVHVYMVYMYTCVYVYMYIYLYIYMCICIYIYMCTCVCVYASISICVHVYCPSVPFCSACYDAMML